MTKQIFAQGGNTPYSLLGPGDIIKQANLKQIGMGGVSISNGNALFSNFMNPALQTYNYFTVFEAGYLVERKWVSTDKATQRDLQGNLSYLSLTFPLLSRAVKGSQRSRWVVGMGLRPFTFINSEGSRVSYIPQTPAFARETYRGTGGINQWFFSSGVQIDRRFSVGLEAALNFGSLTYLQISTLENVQNFYTLNYTDRLTVSDFNFKLGAAFTDTLSKHWLIHTGVTLSPQSRISAVFNRSVIRKDLGDRTIATDTIINDQKTDLTMPTRLGLGMSLEKISTPLNPFKITLSLEYHQANWQNYRNPVGSPALNQLSNTNDLRFGLEFIPNPLAVTGYWKRVQYRFGLQFAQTPWKIDNQQINDQNLSLGMSLPVGRNYTFFSWALLVGQRGQASATRIGENYAKLLVGLTINDKWFVRRKFL
jgi:hypothetical protein